MTIYLSNRQKALPIKAATLRRRLARLLRELELEACDLSVSLVDDEEMRALNRRYRRRNRPTNVLSFPLDGGDPRPAGAPRSLGDIVVSLETVVREAGEQGWPPGEMFYFYLVHGLTHLLGYDHELGLAEAVRQEAETERLFHLIRHTL